MVIKKILVTGGAGFIGSHLCDRLIENGHCVVCLDNFQTGSQKNIEHLLNHSRFKCMDHDIAKEVNVEVDQIYNLACPASPVHYQSNPVRTAKTNVLGAISVLDLATKLDATVFQASTSEIYGEPHVSPQNELYWGNVNPIGVRACYNEGKRFAEALFFDYKRHFKTKVKVARIFNTYGPRMSLNDGRVIPNFISQALQNLPITIYGDGEQTRSFCYIDDLINGIMKLMSTPSDFNGPVNLGRPHAVTVLNLAERIIDLTNSSSVIKFLPLPADDPSHRLPDIALARNQLSWEPCVGLDEGLTNTIKYMQKLMKQNNYSFSI